MKDNPQVVCINNIRNSYLIGFSLVNFFVFAFYLFIYFLAGIKGDVPIYMEVYLVISFFLWLILYLQEKGKIFRNFSRDNYKSRLCLYFLVNILSGYNIPFLVSSAYVFYFSGSRDDAFSYWIILALLIFISIFGLFLFGYGEFEIFGNEPNTFAKIVGIMLIVLSIAALLYLSFVVPVDSEENRTIWVGIIFLLCVHVLVGRSLFYLGLLNTFVKEDGVEL